MFFKSLFTKNKQIKNDICSDNDETGNQKKINRKRIIPRQTIIENKENPQKKTKTKEHIIEFKNDLGMTYYKNEVGEIIILQVKKNSLTDKLGFQKEDIITKINSEDIKNISLKEFEKIIKEPKENTTIICKNKTIIINNKKDNKQEKNKKPNITPKIIIKKEINKPKFTKTAKTKPLITPKENKPQNIITTPIYTIPKQTISVISIPIIKKSIDNAKPITKPKIQNKQEIKQHTENITDNPKKVEQTKEIKEQEPQKEAFLLNKFLEEDIKEKELKVLKNQNKIKTITELISENYTSVIIPLPLLLFRYRIVKKFFSMALLTNRLTIAINTLNQHQNYYLPNYLNFLSKKKTIEETEFLTLKNINLVKDIKENIIKQYNEQIYTNPELINIINKLDELKQNLQMSYKNQIEKKNQKVKKKKIQKFISTT